MIQNKFTRGATICAIGKWTEYCTKRERKTDGRFETKVMETRNWRQERGMVEQNVGKRSTKIHPLKLKSSKVNT